jgi:hypothetical protein
MPGRITLQPGGAMLKITKPTFFAAVLIIAVLAAVALNAGQPKDAAPIPVQITAAKKVFISNAGQDDLGGFSPDPDRTYNRFYSAVKTWGQYQLVSAPADADLVFEISFGVQAVGTNVVKGDSVGTGYAPSFRLTILDPKTHFTLWTFNQHVQWAILAGNRDKNFDQGMADLMSGLKKLTGDPTSVQAAAN